MKNSYDSQRIVAYINQILYDSDPSRITKKEKLVLGATIDQLQTYMQEGRLSARDLVVIYLSRIKRVDQSGVMLNSVSEINQDVISDAWRLDRERRKGRVRSPLHGIPVLIKENIETKEPMATSAGVFALTHFRTKRDAFIVRKLREAGAIILGKSNLTEFANFVSSQMPNGYSSKKGQTLNPYGPGRLDTGGSSAGSGVAVAADLVTVAIGTETAGSILSPSSQNSIVGIKPTTGLLSRSGIIPLASSFDTPGPMAKSVKDAAYVLTITAGMDPEDPATQESQQYGGTDYTQNLDSSSLEGARIGVPQMMHELTNDEAYLFQRAIEDLKKAGAQVTTDIPLGESVDEEVYYMFIDVLCYEFKRDFTNYLQKNQVHMSLKEIIMFNEQEPNRRRRYGQDLLLRANYLKMTEEEYQEKLEEIKKICKDNTIEALLETYDLDAILFINNKYSYISAIAGFPSITVPAGYKSNGEPLNITFTSSAYTEQKLIRYAYTYEQLTRNRIPPKL